MSDLLSSQNMMTMPDHVPSRRFLDECERIDLLKTETDKWLQHPFSSITCNVDDIGKTTFFDRKESHVVYLFYDGQIRSEDTLSNLVTKKMRL